MKKIYTGPYIEIDVIPTADIITMSVADYGSSVDSIDFSDF